jgi:hypothetical protein
MINVMDDEPSPDSSIGRYLRGRSNIMVHRGEVRNGVIVLDKPTSLPEGTRVSVRALKSQTPQKKAQNRSGKPRSPLRRHSGKVKSLPADAARNLDYYLYGHPKR